MFSVDKPILVLLSTYNGNLYLREQLDTIISQKGVDVHILVRDDGSNDGTQKILEQYSLAHPCMISWYQGENMRSARSFMDLIYKAQDFDYEYYAFADQDDYWMDDKLLAAINQLSKAGKSDTPLLYFSQYQMADKNLNMLPTVGLSPTISFGHAMVDNVVTGCTIVFNKYLLRKIGYYMPDYMIMHDDWIYKICLGVGGTVVYDPIPHILYRQHGGNVIGGIGNSLIKKWCIRMKKIFSSNDNHRLKIAMELKKGYYGALTENNKILLDSIIGYKTSFNRFKLLINKQLQGQSLEGSIRCKFMLLTGKF